MNFLNPISSIYIMMLHVITIRPNVPYIKVSLPTNSSIGGTDGASG